MGLGKRGVGFEICGDILDELIMFLDGLLKEKFFHFVKLLPVRPAAQLLDDGGKTFPSGGGRIVEILLGVENCNTVVKSVS